MFRAKTEFTHCSSMIAKLSTNRGTQLDILSKAEPPKRPHCLWQLFVHILIIILIGYYHLYYIYCFAILFEIFASTRVYITLSLRISCSEFVKGIVNIRFELWPTMGMFAILDRNLVRFSSNWFVSLKDSLLLKKMTVLLKLFYLIFHAHKHSESWRNKFL